jgi:DNA helicase-2/ATP-dependent DNA helicase PcrA
MLMEIHKRAIEDGKVYSPSDITDLVKIHGHFPYAYDDLKTTMQKKTGDAVLEYLNINQKDFNKIEFAEKEIQIDLGDGVMINGRVDLIKKMDQSSGVEKITIVDFKSAEDVQTVNITMEQLSLYAIGYQELSGKTPNFLQIYNMDDNTPKTREIQNTDLDGMKKRIITSAEEIRKNNFTKTTDNKTCQSCRRNMICSGCTI